MKKSKFQYRIIIFSALFLFVGLVSGFLIASVGINKNIAEQGPSVSNQELLNVYESKRAPYSFSYPKDYKIGIIDNDLVYQFANRIDAVNLGTFDNAPNAGGDATGYIIVSKTDYLADQSIEDMVMKEYEQQVKFLNRMNKKNTISKPVITPVMIGNADGFKVVSKPSGTFAVGDTTYYVDRRGIMYQIGVTTTDPDEVKKIEDILATFEFEY